MSIKTIYSSKDSVKEAVQELQAQAQGINPKLVLFFASAKYDKNELAQEMAGSFQGASTLGCSTAGEIVSGKMLKGSIVAMLLDSNIIADAKVEVLEKIKTGNPVPSAFKNFEEYYRTPMMQMDPKKYVGIILVDGLSGSEEKLMEKIGDLTNIVFVGASAGDDLKFQETNLFADGRSYTDASVLVLMKPNVEFDFIKTQSFSSTGKKLVATKVDEEKRMVMEFNNQSAAKAYAEALNISEEKASEHFMSHPVGLMAGTEPYVRSPQQIQNENMVFYCNIKQGMELNVLESTDIVADTKHAIENKKKELKNISGIINFHCILRTLELENKGLTEAYGQIFNDIPTVGFSTYGEEFVGHINQTSTMLVFK